METWGLGARMVKALAKRGIKIYGLTTIPDYEKPLPYASGERGYLIDDRGTGRVWTFKMVREAVL